MPSVIGTYIEAKVRLRVPVSDHFNFTLLESVTRVVEVEEEEMFWKAKDLHAMEQTDVYWELFGVWH